ncbi:hypothetical protein GE300_20090 [Rhodobacteraceae bacterium 2CG4]|uniref:Uncharacterized protein n=1 Tax=Halovulum marinum TaxID=2662447 RepID=A0A6L5Z6A6_9RHOB|nr:hypothetical protein [Halovulum marinum]MSU91879.1 hypothetical protein [Halovulum marinum]
MESRRYVIEVACTTDFDLLEHEDRDPATGECIVDGTYLVTQIGPEYPTDQMRALEFTRDFGSITVNWDDYSVLARPAKPGEEASRRDLGAISSFFEAEEIGDRLLARVAVGRLVPIEALEREDLDGDGSPAVAGFYAFEVKGCEGRTRSDIRDVVLEHFHTEIGIENLDDYNIQAMLLPLEAAEFGPDDRGLDDLVMAEPEVDPEP